MFDDAFDWLLVGFGLFSVYFTFALQGPHSRHSVPLFCFLLPSFAPRDFSLRGLRLRENGSRYTWDFFYFLGIDYIPMGFEDWGWGWGGRDGTGGIYEEWVELMAVGLYERMNGVFFFFFFFFFPSLYASVFFYSSLRWEMRGCGERKEWMDGCAVCCDCAGMMWLISDCQLWWNCEVRKLKQRFVACLVIASDEGGDRDLQGRGGGVAWFGGLFLHRTAPSPRL
jgi:hypothetical protein